MKVFQGLFSRFLFRRILYWADPPCLFGRDGRIRNRGKESQKRVDVVVVEKSAYFETLQTFPFTGIKDIQSAIRTDMAAFSPFLQTEHFFVRKVSEQNGKTSVNIWFIDPECSRFLKVSAPRLVFPESALLALGEKGMYAIDKGAETLLVYSRADGLVRSKTGRNTDVDILNFRRNIGAEARDCEVRSVQGMNDYLSLLHRCLRAVPLRSIWPFLNRDGAVLPDLKRNLWLTLGMAASLLLLFFALSLWFPYATERRLSAEEKALSHELRDVLKQQEDLEYYYQRQKALAGRINDYPRKLELMTILHRVLPEKTRIRRIAFSGNVVEMKGSTPKGSQLLSTLGREKGIRNARFTSRVLKDPKTGMEMFSVSFVYEAKQEAGGGVQGSNMDSEAG